jgi:chromate reductase
VPANTTLEIFDLAGIPGFNRDQEQQPPARVSELKARVRAADAVLFVTPEYNYSIDWASQPYGDTAWDGKPVAVMRASIGAMGTARAPYHLRQSFVFLNMYALNRPEVMITNVSKRFDEAGNLIDDKPKALVQELPKNLVSWARRLSDMGSAPGLMAPTAGLAALIWPRGMPLCCGTAWGVDGVLRFLAAPGPAGAGAAAPRVQPFGGLMRV